MLDRQITEQEAEMANKMSHDLIKLLIKPLDDWIADRDNSYQNQMLVLANVIAILGCMCILERIFGTETLRPFIEMAKKEAGDLENATRH